MKLGNLAAFFTDNMVVIVNSSLQAGSPFPGLDSGDKTVLLQSQGRYAMSGDMVGSLRSSLR